MSPASSGALEIERYIGACLISSQQGRHKGKYHHLPQQPPSQTQHHQQQHNHHQHNLVNHGNHGYVPDLYRGFHHPHHPQAPQQHVLAAAAAVHQQPQQQIGGGDRWAGGLPLVAYAKHQQQQQQQQHRQYVVAGNWPRRIVDVSSSENRIPQSLQQQQQSPDCNNPLSRLAVHTQGAPLILSNNRYRNKNKGKFNAVSGDNIGCVNKQLAGNSLISCNQVKSTKCRENNVDTVSVASDESSGSANSENCLPRIIKPRKRRKKDRKPPLHLSTTSASRSVNQDDSFSTDSGATTSPDSIGVTTPILSIHLPPSFPLYNSTCERITSDVTLSGNNDISETPTLHHSFEDIEDHLDVTDINGNVESSCQCRYCDPSGQIWDIDRNCYSPFLTTPVENMFRFSISPSSYKMSESSTIDQYLPSYSDVDQRHHHHQHNQCLVNGISSFSLEDKKSSKGDIDKVSYCIDDSYLNHQQHRSETDLEVSTEIVTSLNGHRDLEIKFFSSSASIKKEYVEVDGYSAESEIDNQAGYLLFDTNCKKMLTSLVCD